jgi:RNA polymerase primary sigma factor
MRDSDRFIDVAFGDTELDKLLGRLQPGDSLSAAALLTVMDGENEDTLQETFDRLREQNVVLDVTPLAGVSGTGETAIRLKREQQLVQDGQLLSVLEETDPLRLYLEEIAGIPAFGDICLLAEQLDEANREKREEPELWTQILNLCLSRVYELACEHTGLGVLLMDLMQEGSMGLWSALPCYAGGDFEAFRDWHIRQAMAQTITLQAFSNGVGQKMRQAMEDYRSVDERLLAELGRNPTLEEIAQQLHMTVEETTMVASMLESARNVNRAHVETEEKEPEPDDQQAVEDTAYFQLRQRIQELMSQLEPREAELLTLRFGLEGGLPLSPADAGRRLGMTPEEVVAAEAAALRKMRKEG